MGSRVLAPDGNEWSVSRRALLWRPRRRMRFDADAIGLVLGAIALPLHAAGDLAERVRAEIADGDDPSRHADQRAITAGG